MGKLQYQAGQDTDKQDVITKDAANQDQAILTKVSEMMGWVPAPLKLMAQRPGTVQTFMAHRNQVFEGGPLDYRERSLVALSSAVALKSAKCLRSYTDHARKARASEEEIVQTMLIASVLSSAAPLHIAYTSVNKEK